ncbi:MAG: NAD-glutamate dehydrogenase [Phycisphaerales bacterium]|nr:NAD-glutamate dehydrogenase [Phycisphaerales bacterium]
MMRANSAHGEDAIRQNPAEVVDEIVDSLRATADEVVPWFLGNMPLTYFQDTDLATELSHLRAIIAAKASGRPLELTLRSKDGSQWTMMRPLDYPGVLAEMVRELPHDRPLRAAKIHTATDGALVVDTFEFGDVDPVDLETGDGSAKLQQIRTYAKEHPGEIDVEVATDYLRRCSAQYVKNVTPIRMSRHMTLFHQVAGTDGTAVVLEPEDDPNVCRIVVAVSNSATRMMFERIVTRLSASSINIHRAYLDTIMDDDGAQVVLLGFVVSRPDGGCLDIESPLWRAVQRDLLRMKWLDERTLELAYKHHDLGLRRAEIIVALCELIHQSLVKVNPFAFSIDRIARLAERNLAQATRIADLFLERFHPDGPLDDAASRERIEVMREEIENDVDLEESRTVLHKLIDVVAGTFRTNVFVPNRYGLALRIDPQLLVTDERAELPFGVFFVHGRAFTGFHVRFRDIARGGIRAIRPIGLDQYARENERTYDEAYHLAFAQQLKNKDIPEGGAKAAVLIEPGAPIERSVKGFVDGLLDLVTPDAETRSYIVDRFGQDELLYLGPDENITPKLINWIVERARRRGYATPTALMSSKPGAGINHKEYGVTSEGVNVFLDSALRSVGIDPRKTPFTVKLTGGPDGDVAGNMIRIFQRDYGTNARIVGIADGSGCGEDPDGLNLDELMRLVTNSLPIAEFDQTKLGDHGRITTLDQPDGVHLRNTLHNRIVADAFVPCGGRPNAIHAGNWRDWLVEGKPSSKVIVEGANLFLTPEARVQLSHLGTVIMKDSSANKCGVICSSYEIAACMMLEDHEFMAIKEKFVLQVLDRLRFLARPEAELLGRVHRYHPQIPLPEVSIRLSRVMIRTADAIEAAIDTLTDDDQVMLRRLVIEHLPPILVETAGERLWERTPRAYLKWIMAKSLAARIVYREGFENLQTMSTEAIVDLAIRYMRMELERDALMGEILKSDMPDRGRIAELMASAGILSTLGEGTA